MSNPIDINALKTGGTQGIDASTDKIVDPNLAGKNVEGKDIRDFGNGMKEFDPTANGFQAETANKGKSDEQKALELFDQQIEARQEEVRAFNELLEINGGSVTEEELRQANGEDFITKQLRDGAGDVNDDGNAAPAPTAPSVEDTSNLFEDKEEDDSDELAALEKELEEDDNMSIASSVSVKEEKSVSTGTTQQEPISAAVSNPSKVVDFVPRKESVEDENGESEEDKDLAALDGVPGEESTDDDFESKLKAELNKKLQPVSRKLNLSTTTIVQKPVNVNHLIERTQNKNSRVFTWALMRSGRPITIQSFNATELNVLNSNARNANMTLEVFRTIWKHIVGAKGDSFEAWCKSTSYFDTNHIWMAIYGACFERSNYLPFSCPKCNDVTVTTDTPIMDMVNFANDEAKQRFNDIRNMRDDDPAMGNCFAVQLVQVSDDIVIGFREPSIYTSIVENSLYDSEFRRKYSDIINIISYIENIYMIDEDENLRPVSTKEYVNNDSKTAKAKVIQYAKIIRNLSSDEYSTIMANIIEMGKTSDDVSYKMPEITCDHCKATIPSENQDASGLVFTRHQLVMFGA